MAERSGHAQLDQLIDRFACEPYGNGWRSDVSDEWGDISAATDEELAEMDILRGTIAERLPQMAPGQCHVFASRFANYVWNVGLEAISREDPEQPRSPDHFGYQDRSVPGLWQHCVTLVETDEGVFMVDWTAGQYGYAEFPMVQRQAADGRWQRQW